MREKIYSIALGVLLGTLTIGCENNSKAPVVDYTGHVDSVADIEGNSYKTVGIGSQIWMAENLKATRLNDGTIIPEELNDSIWTKLLSPSLCWYDNDSLRYQKSYGPLYNSYVVNSGKLCPIGWHVPDKSEWNTLATFLGGAEVAGGKLKESNGFHWNEPNTCILSNYNFIALPGGFRRGFNGQFLDQGNMGYWWTSSSESLNIADCFSMLYSNTKLVRFETNYRDGHSVRCVKD